MNHLNPNPDNIGYICKVHSDKRHKEWQKENVDTVINVGDHVKVAFKDHSIKVKEHMWVLVTSIEENVIRGTLDNVPLLLTNYIYNQEVKVTREHVCDYIKN